ncbi:MAG: repressor LexA [Chitinophagaceae bacterium]|nr:repressor LexA [Oligoflexus sp.]
MQKLTSRQTKAFEFIRSHSDAHGYAPTLRELCEYMGYKAVGSAQDVIASLRKKGYIITPDKQTARSLALTDRSKQYLNVQLENQWDNSLLVPRLGSVPAGTPIEAIEDFSGAIRISSDMLPRWAANSPEKLFALQAKGASMIYAGILDGDWLIVSQQSDAPSGTIVVADAQGSSTVKRLMNDPEQGWYLKPENPAFNNLYAKDEAFTILGRVVALQRIMTDTLSSASPRR